MTDVPLILCNNNTNKRTRVRDGVLGSCLVQNHSPYPPLVHPRVVLVQFRVPRRSEDVALLPHDDVVHRTGWGLLGSGGTESGLGGRDGGEEFGREADEAFDRWW